MACHEDLTAADLGRQLALERTHYGTRYFETLSGGGFGNTPDEVRGLLNRLSRIEAKQRLIILVTDGKPLDRDYDPNSRYAQYDVRMACEENERRGIHAFGISTEQNSLSDMEIMFPRRRFAILPDIRVLPRILPKLYIRLTV